MSMNKKKINNTKNKNRITANKKALTVKKNSSIRRTPNVTTSSVVEHFRVPMVEIKPIDAVNVKYNYAYRNDQRNWEQQQLSNQVNQQVKNQINQLEEIDNKIIEELNQKVIDLNEKNKQWQSKYDHLNNEFENYKKEHDSLGNDTNNDNQNQNFNNDFQARSKKDRNHTNIENNEMNNQTVQQLQEQIDLLTNQLETERQKMVEKIQEKANEAKKIIDEKVEELELQKQQDVASNKLKVFESTINAFLDPYIIFKNTLNSINNPEINNYLQGFRMIADMIKDNLINLGVEEIMVNIGDNFDETYMVAFDVVEDHNFQHNQVVKIVNPGYVFSFKNEQRVLKFVSVVVAK